MAKKQKLPGSLFQRNGRWSWRVKLPGSTEFKNYALRSAPGKPATKNKSMAEGIAREMFEKATLRDKQEGDFNGTIASLIQLYLEHADKYYRHQDGTPTSEPPAVRDVAKALFDSNYGQTDVDDFDCLALQDLRQVMIDSKRLCRKTVNDRIGRIKRIFKWGASQKLVSPTTFYSLQSVDGLRIGRTDAIDHPRKTGIDVFSIEAIFPYTTSIVKAMIQVQLYTAMRPNEMLIMRPCDIDRTGEIWFFNIPDGKHKTAHHGIDKSVPIGPKAQKALMPFLLRPAEMYCFSPAESTEERRRKRTASRKTPLSCGNKIGTNCKGTESLGDKYTPASYRKAVTYAITKANKDLDVDNQIEKWTPYQLRKSQAKTVRDDMGIRATAALLGHADLDTAKIYAEMRRDEAIEAVKKFG